MASSFSSITHSKPLQQYQDSISPCKSSTPLRFHIASDFLLFSSSNHTFQPKVSFFQVRLPTVLSSPNQQVSHGIEKFGSGFARLGHKLSSVVKKSLKDEYLNPVVQQDTQKEVVLKNRHARKTLNSVARTNKDSHGVNMARNSSKIERNKVLRQRISKDSNVEKLEKVAKKNKGDSPEVLLRVGLDMCSKKGDVLGAIQLYDLALKQKVKMGQYHYAVLLYLCSSAATGVVQPAKSGSNVRSLATVDSSDDVSGVDSIIFGEVEKRDSDYFVRSAFNAQVSVMRPLNEANEIHENDAKKEFSHTGFVVGVPKDDPDSGVYEQESLNGTMKTYAQTLDELVHSLKQCSQLSTKDTSIYQRSNEILLSEDIRRYALQKGFEIYENMCLDHVSMNEATFTSVARMAMSMGNGGMAFDIVKQMKAQGISPRLRSYGPALSVFCNNGDVEKAFIVEEHMLEHGVHPEGPELEALLKVSIEANRSDKVYYLLHKLRTSVRQVSSSIADLIEKWFKSTTASRVGKRKWDPVLIKNATEARGGGWHGQGWLGKGKWTVVRTSIASDGLCNCCNEKLTIIDLDPVETEKFAESVVSIARQRERNSSFERFQKWLDYYGPFEAVVDGANVGLFSQRNFQPSKVNAVVNGIRQMLPSKKFPLIVLHNRRITGDKMDSPFNQTLIQKWKNADALYATPTGSNDDWYWLYAAIKFKCLIVTNDEMRDHLFQLLGNDFFPKWKERHQVHFSFSDTGPVFHMPPPCSFVIQETEKGHWHIPFVTEHEYEEERMWLCITRDSSPRKKEDAVCTNQELSPSSLKDRQTNSNARTKPQLDLAAEKHGRSKANSDRHPPEQIYGSLTNILSSSTTVKIHPSVLKEIEAAEKIGCCVIDFHI